MALIFRCSRNHTLAVDPSLAGKRVRCPRCQEILTAPLAAPAAGQPAPPASEPVQPSQIPPPAPEPVAPAPAAPALPTSATMPSAPASALPLPPDSETPEFPLLEMELPAKAAAPAPPCVSAGPQAGIIAFAGEGPTVTPAAPPAAAAVLNPAPGPSASAPPAAILDPAPNSAAPVAVLAPAVTGAEAVAAPATATTAAAEAAPGVLAYAVADEPPRRVADYLDFVANLLQRKGRRQQIDTVRFGLAFHYWKYLVSIVSVLLLSSGVLLLTVPFPIWIGMAAVALGYLGNFTAPILGMAGSFFCIQAPEKTKTRPFLVVALGLDSAGLLLTLLSFCIAVFSHNSGIVVALGWFCTLASFVLFMLFLRALALFLNDPGSADEAISIIVSLVAITLGGLVTTAFGAALFHWLIGGESAKMIAFLVILICVGLYLQLMFRILALISTLRTRM